MEDTRHYAFVPIHQMHTTKNEPQPKLQTLAFFFFCYFLGRSCGIWRFPG